MRDTELIRKLEGPQIVKSGKIGLTFITNVALGTYLSPGISDIYANREKYIVQLTVEGVAGTPYAQVTDTWFSINNDNTIRIVATGGGFVSGHALSVAYTIIKL